MWDTTGYSNYHALQTSINRRFDNGLMFSVFYVWSKTLGPAATRLDHAGFRTPPTRRTRRVDYSYTDYDRPHNFVVNFVYQTPKVASGVARRPRERLADLGHLPLDERPAVRASATRSRASGATTSPAAPTSRARVVLTCDPGKGSSSDPYKQFDTSCFAPPQAGSKGDESARFFLHAPPINNLDLSLSKTFSVGKGIRLEVRLDAFNALNHTQFTGVNSTANFASLTDPTITNLPYDASGNLSGTTASGRINGVARRARSSSSPG